MYDTISTKTRDRKGGHNPHWLYTLDGWLEPFSPNGARFIKKLTRRFNRRQSKEIIRHDLYEETDYG